MNKRNIFYTLIISLVLTLILGAIPGFAAQSDLGDNDIVIIYESDVHCSVDGYEKIAALRSEEREKGNGVSLVSCGDFIQGGPLGSFSKGEYIIDIMNAVGYDAVTLGNHEFDYTVPVLEKLAEQFTGDIVSCNYIKVSDEKPVYEPYKMISYGDTDIAFVGISTPETFSLSSVKRFMDESNNYVYDFCGTHLYETVQKAVDDARQDGAEYVIALAHLGSEGVTEGWASQDVARNTSGIDVILDGHSHSVIPEMKVADKSGDTVLISSVGTKFEYMGKLTIESDGDIKTELIKTEDYLNTDEEAAAAVKAVKDKYKTEGERVVGKSDVFLTINDNSGNRIVRNHETNSGNFFADALRNVMDTDIAFINGGGVRGDINKGVVTYNDLLVLAPFDNKVCAAEVTGSMITDLLEFSVRKYPDENGGFMQVSGLKFEFDPDIPSSVKMDEKGMMESIGDHRRVKNVEILNKESGKYEPIEPEKIYSAASISYILKENGDGLTVFDNAKIIDDLAVTDIEVLCRYIQEHLGGTIGEEYKDAEGRISEVKTGDTPEKHTFKDVTPDKWYYESVEAVASKGLMVGVTDTMFAPNDKLTRGMFVTTIYRMEKEPKSEGELKFADVAEDAYYKDAVLWANANGIVSGISDSKFAPDDKITREQMAAVIFNYAKYKEKGPVGLWAIKLDYNDLDQLSDYAGEAAMFCTMKKIMMGDDNGGFAPKRESSRAEAAAVLIRMAEQL